MKKRLMYMLVCFICVAVLFGCAEEKHISDQNAFQSIAQVGQIPDEFKRIVANNAFNGVTAFENRLLKSEIVETKGEDRTVSYEIKMMDLYGNGIATYACNSNDAYHVNTLTATHDGGFLFVLGFSDYAYDQNAWASDNGFASRIIKCDKDGALQFDTSLDNVEGRALRHCFEKDENYYFFGTIETAETKTRGVGSRSDIYMVVLDKTGTVVNSQCIAGSDFDRLDTVEMSGDRFILSISAQSDDGDFVGSQSNGYPEDWVFTVNDALEITGKEITSGRDYFDKRLGEKDGKAIYKSDALLNDFDAGIPEIFVDYGDFYLIVSSNNTGVYENTPSVISSIWYYTESVYSAYDDSGNLIFRASVDSSPDYDAIVQEFYGES